MIPAAVLLLLACTHLPAIAPKDGAFSAAAGEAIDSNRIFPQGRWQFLHAIRIEMPGGNHISMMGLTVMSSRLQARRSVIMTLEGLVVFDGECAESDRQVRVHRALPPFDSPHFAGGLMEDIRLVFFEPDGPILAVGQLEKGVAVRRHQSPDGGVVDIEALVDGTWQIKRYSPSHKLTRTVRGLFGEGERTGFPKTIELTASGDADYRLVMTLIEAVCIEQG
jgi:hypothetical protein